MAQIANYMTAPRPKAPPRKKRERRDGDDPAYLALLRQCPCAVSRCYTTTMQAHHQNHLWPGRGKAQKCPDRLCIPISWNWHDMLHRYGSKRHAEILLSWGVNGEALANELWHIYQNAPADERLERMRAAVMGHTAERKHI